MPARKRTFDELQSVDVPLATTVQAPSLLTRVRNCWHFAALVQYIFFFGSAVKIDRNVDVDLLEEECLKSPSTQHLLGDIGLALLKHVSSHRGLNTDLFDEYTRRQYLAKASGINPFGVEEEPKHFADFDVFTKLSVLHQLSVWTLNNPERIREKMEEKDNEQTQWRIEPLGWDSDDRSYFVLDDDRLYRRTDPPLPPQQPTAKPKPKAKKSSKRNRRSTRNQPSEIHGDSGAEDEDLVRALEASKDDGDRDEVEAEADDGLGGAKWECLAVSLADYNAFLDGIKKSRDPNEKALHVRIIKEVLPVLEKRAEAQERKVAQRRRELENIEKLATAKRSSRLADKMERHRAEVAADDAERKRRDELVTAQREQERLNKLEEARESRMVTREQRLRERETKRILHEEQLRRLRDEETPEGSTGARASERNRKNELEKTQKALEQLNQDEEEEEWYFDCAICGVHGKNLDDGSHSMACEKCSVWQHSACNGISEAQAESDEFHFVCASCRKPKITSLKLKLGPSSSPKEDKVAVNGTGSAATVVHNGIQKPAMDIQSVMETPVVPLQSLPDGKTQPVGDADSTVPNSTTDRYLAKSQGTFPPQAKPNGYSALVPDSGLVRFGVQANGMHSSSSSPPQQQQIAHNPYLNVFARQSASPTSNNKSPSSTTFSAHGNPRFPTTSPPQSNRSMTSTLPSDADPLHPIPTSANLAATSIPSLNATEGNTSVRFSASPKPTGSPRSISYEPVPLPPPRNSASAEQYHRQQQQTIPRSTRSISPVKSSPPPMTPMLQPPRFIANATTPLNPVNNVTSLATSPEHSPLPATNGGISPTKHSAPRISVPAPLTVTSYDGTLDVASSPILSPSVNAGRLNLSPPIKKQITPAKAQRRLSSSPSPSPRLEPSMGTGEESPGSPVKRAISGPTAA